MAGACPKDCQLDAQASFDVRSTGGRVFIRALPSHAAMPALPEPENASCSDRRALFRAAIPQELFDITNPWTIRGIGSLRDNSFQ